MELLELTRENIETYLDQCLTLQIQLVPAGTAINAAQFTATAESPSSYFLAVLEEGKVMAMGVISSIAHPAGMTGYVNNIIVDEKQRGKGLFSVIMDALETKAKEWGCTELALSCSRPNVQPLYEKRAYKQKETKFYLKTI